MAKQFLVVGLGNFGYYLATQLFDLGHDVLAIDKNPELVQNIKDQVTQAVVADATDAKAMDTFGVKEMDAVVVSIGSVLSDSILAVLNFQEAGARKIYAKAINDAHKRILEKIGVKNISFPEKDIALTMARQMHNPNLIDYLPFMEGYGLIELSVPDFLSGQSLKQANLTNRFGIQIVAIKELVPERMHFIPKADFILKSSDILFLFGPEAGLNKIKSS